MKRVDELFEKAKNKHQRKEASGMGIYQRGNQWWIEFSYKGVRHREAVGPDEELAEDVLAKRRVEIRENRFFPDKQKELEPILFYDFAKEYFKWRRTDKKPSTYRADLCYMRYWTKKFEGKYLHEITENDIEDWKTKRADEVKVASVNRELMFIKHLFKTALRRKKRSISENPAREVKRLKGEAKRLRYLMPDEIRKLLQKLPEYLKPLATLVLHSGARKGELLNLKWQDIDFENGIISLLDTKNNQRRDIPMDETARMTLKELDQSKRLPYVFYKEQGKRFNRTEIFRSLDKGLKEAGISDFRWHDFRHCFASYLVMAGVNIMVVKDYLGHTQLSQTLRYAHLSPEYKKGPISVLDRVMSQNPPQQEKEKQAEAQLMS